MEGRFVSIVADLSHLAGQTSLMAPNGYEMSLCHLGFFGALYKRSTPVPATFQVIIGTATILAVEKITADASTPITNTLDIMLRQQVGTELAWVTFTQKATVTEVNFAPDRTVTPGTYSLVLESFDLAGGVFSALKTDTVSVTVESGPQECLVRLSQSKTFETAQPILLTKEYEPTVFFPEILFSGPHTYTDYSCGGTYTQSIAIDSPLVGVTITDQPAGPDLRPSLSIGPQAPAGSSFTLTFTGRYVHAPSATNFVSSFNQRYQLKTVFSTDYLA